MRWSSFNRATLNYMIGNCLSKPATLVVFALFTCFLFLLHQCYFDDTVLQHSAGLTRRNTSIIDYGEITQSDRYSYSIIHDKSLLTVKDLELRIEDLRRIKLSLTNELRSIEREKSKVLREKNNLITRNDKLISQISRSKNVLRQLELDISANRKRNFEHSCDTEQISPIIFNPLKSSNIEDELLTQITDSAHRDENIPMTAYTFDHSLCPLAKQFKFSLYRPSIEQDGAKQESFKIEPSVIVDILVSHHLYTSSVDDACLLIHLPYSKNSSGFESNKNNLVIDLSVSHGQTTNSYSSERTAIASHRFIKGAFRNEFDIALPSLLASPVNYELILGSIPPQSPIERKYLASYFGQGSGARSSHHDIQNLSPMEKVLQVIHRNSIDDLFLFKYNCGTQTDFQCYSEREKMIELSTFLIIIPSPNRDLDDKTSDMIYLGLSRGSIPVIIGKEKTRLPFDEVIDWRRAAIMIHSARLTEIHFILRSIGPSDIYQLKYHGRRIFENYLATAKQAIDTMISVLSLERFSYPPHPISNIKSRIHYRKDNLSTDPNCTAITCLETEADIINGSLTTEILGPREMPLASLSYTRNYSLVFNSAYDLWNSPIYSPIHLHPSYPIDPIAPSEYKFLSTDQNFRPIADGLGGSGAEFSRSLGGDFINEQFTIVLLTYERESMLLKTLGRLKGLPYLNKVIVVWNGIKNPPAKTIVWPDVGVPIKVIKVAKNSLNNRFLPFDEIETDAILSLDDDSPIRQDEIVFAFRVWRESRDRIVGFPGRYHAWDRGQNSWIYNSNHSCELSMVLTGGAFFHRYYSYIYTFNMPRAIRSIVDRFMNCEDIAMNFLVAHLTRKPPLKVTSRWTFHCSNCVSSLSEEDSHFRERHECLNMFASIYGYMPLLSTQHRSDSILFKTRLPHDRQKCFRFV